MKKFAIGIDFGTTKTLVSYFNEETGKPGTVLLERETDSLPTSIDISKDKHQFFGKNADEVPELLLLVGRTSQIPIIEARMKQASGLAYHRLQWSRKVATLLGVTLLAYGNGSQWAKADVMVRGEEGKTMLMMTVELEDVKKINKDVERGADVNAKDNYGYTALIWAASKGKVEAIEVLVRHRANVNARDNDGGSALMEAAVAGQVEAIEALVRHRANVNARDNYGMTALRWAASEGQAEAIEALVRHGANVNAKDNWEVL